MADMARLGVGIELVGRRARAGDADRRAGARRRRPPGRGAAVRRCRGGQVAAARPSWSSAPAPLGLPGARRPLPGHRRVGAAVPAVHRDRRGAGGRRAPRAGRRSTRAAPPAARPPPASPSRPPRTASSARCGCSTPCCRCSTSWPRRRRRWWCWRTCTGPTGPAGTCWCSCCPGSSDQRLLVVASYRTDDLHRRHPLRPVLAELVRLPAVRAGGAGPARPGEPAGTGRAGWPTARCPSRPCSAPPGAARATPSSPRSWSRPGPTGMPHELAELLVARIDGLAAGHPAGAADRLGRRAPGPARPAGRRVRAGRPTSWSRRCATRWPHHVLVAERGSASGDAYAFRHALLREAVYHELLPGERSRIHAAYAALLAEPSTGQPGPASRAGPPSWRTTRWPGTTCRWRWPRRSGRPREADEREAPAELLLHAERALELWPAVPDAEAVAGVDEVTRDPVGGVGGQRHRRSGPRHRARPARAGAGRAARRSGAVRVAAAAVRAAPAGPGRPGAGGARRRPPGAWSCSVEAAVRPAGLGARGAGPRARPARPVRRRPSPRPRPPARWPRRRPRTTSTRCGRAPTRWSRWPCAPSTAGTRSRRAGSSGRGDRVGPAGRHLGVELRAYFALGLSLLDAGRLRAAGDRARRRRPAGRGHRHHVERLRAGPAGRRWSSPGSCAATGTPRRPPPSWPGSRCRPRWPPGWPRPGCSPRSGVAGSTRSSDGWPSCASTDSADDQVIMLAGQSGAEAALWQGRPGAGLDARAARRWPGWIGADRLRHLGAIMLGRARGGRAGRSGGRRRAARGRGGRGRPGAGRRGRAGRRAGPAPRRHPRARKAEPGCAAPAPS